MSARILVIEDDPASLELMTYLLTAHGYATLAASRGDTGLAQARQECLDLIVCDIQLPGIDGYGIARALKADESRRAVPIVAVTALAMVGDRNAILAAGFDAYVSKPIDPAMFVAQVEPFLDSQYRAMPRIVPQVQPNQISTPRLRGTVLVLDDSPTNVELKRSILEPVGYRIVTAGVVTDGLHLAREEVPMLIISDIGLPGASGLEFLSAAKADPRLQHIPIIIMTSTHLQPATREMALSLGAARFLVRPMEAERVLREVEACLAEAYGDADGDDSYR